MKAKKKTQIEYITNVLQTACEQLKREQVEIVSTMGQIDKAGKYHLGLDDTDMSRVNRFFRGKYEGVRMAIEKLTEIQRNVWDAKKRML